MKEPEVLLKTHAYLKSHGLSQHSIARLFTDAHSTLIGNRLLEPFQRFFVQVGDVIVHPDLVGQWNDGETVFAIEAKGEDDLLKGIAQAEIYKFAFHQAFLAADARALTTGWIEIARRRGVGVVAVSDTVQVLHSPDVSMPLRDPFQLIRRQMDSAVQVSRGQTFLYNLPTHYLVWAIVLQPHKSYAKAGLPNLIQGYPMPAHWDGALRGARKLGLVKAQGDAIHLTEAGAAVKVLLPGNLAEWAEVHETIKARGGMTLAQCRPYAAAALRILLLHDPVVQLVVEGLRTSPQHSANFAELARVCGQLDHARAPVFFLKPESAATRTDERGRLCWDLIASDDYRSSTFQQYKSILIHGGILSNTGLGGTTIRGYDPTQDLWELATS